VVEFAPTFTKVGAGGGRNMIRGRSGAATLVTRGFDRCFVAGSAQAQTKIGKPL
jgi:hypothetical protein